MTDAIYDYTQNDTFNNHLSQQYRALKYIRDILNNWFSDKSNILDQRLIPLLYDNYGNLNKQCIKLGTAFDSQKTYIGTTPAIVIQLGDIQYSMSSINYGGNPDFVHNPTEPIVARQAMKKFAIHISIVTQSYDATVLLSQLVQLFMVCNCDMIKEDCKMFDSFFVQSVSKPQQIRAAEQLNAKQLYMSTITLAVTGHVTWLIDTQGPVFNGIQYTLKS